MNRELSMTLKNTFRKGRFQDCAHEKIWIGGQTNTSGQVLGFLVLPMVNPNQIYALLNSISTNLLPIRMFELT